MGGMAELSISTTDADTCGDLCKYQCGNRQGSLVGLQMTAYTISEGGQRHQSLSLSLLPSSVRHFQNHARKPLSRMVSASCRPSTKRPVVQKQCVSECRAKCKNTPAIKSNAKQRRYAHLGGQSPRRHYCLAMRLHASNGEVNIKASRQNHRNFPFPFQTQTQASTRQCSCSYEQSSVTAFNMYRKICCHICVKRKCLIVVQTTYEERKSYFVIVKFTY